MIATIPFAIGFIIYIGFCLITFDVYSKKKDISKILSLILIYLYYTLLAIYVISFVDKNASLFEKIIQDIIYAAPCAVFIYIHFRNVLEDSESEVGYKDSSKDSLF